MKNVYTISFEFCRAFSTARKVIEHVQQQYSDWHIDYGEGQVKFCTTEQLIAKLNKQRYITLTAEASRNCDSTTIYKTEVE